MIKLTPKTILLFHVLTHASVFLMFTQASVWQWGVALFVYFLTGAIGMSGTYHRLLSHKSYNPPKWWEYFGSICGTIGGTGSTLSWVATHREHHRFTETERDPHSPYHHNVWWVQFFSMFHKVNLKYAPDLLRSKFHIAIHTHYWTVHALYASLLLIVGGPFALVYGWLFPSFVLWHAGSFINTLSHMWGTQPNKTKDKSTNNFLLGILVWGEGWHNNHHYDPGNSNFGWKWWQIDITKYIIKLVDRK